MATELLMPRLSDTMESGTVARWLKKVGDRISRGETIAEIETDKANMDMESYVEGILARIIVDEGQSTGLGEPIAIVAANESEAKTIQAGAPPETPAESDQKEPDQSLPEQVGPPTKPQVGKMDPEERLKASPLARRLAQEHNINLASVAGTGPGGRITKEDVQSFLKQVAPVGQPVRQPAPGPASQPSPVPGESGRAPQPVEMTRMQQTIARRMTEARFSKPEFVLTVDIDMTEARSLLRSVSRVEGAPKVGPNDFLIKAVAMALAQHPEVNAGWEGSGIVRYGNINVGNAVAIPGGLVVPVLKDADRKTLGQIAQESKDLIERARTGKLAPHDYEQGTFTVSNLGMYGIEQFTPILNPPEACIIGVGAIEPRPVVRDGTVEVRDRMHISMACDHRVINGAEGAEFLRTLRRFLENPMLVVL